MSDHANGLPDTMFIGCPRCDGKLSAEPEQVVILGWVCKYYCDSCSITIKEAVEDKRCYMLPDGREAIPVDYRVPEDWEWVAFEDKNKAWQVGPDTPRPQPKRLILEVMEDDDN